MKKYVIGTKEVLEELEAKVWVENLKFVATYLWNGTLKDIQTGRNLKVADLNFDELNDRQRFPLLGYTKNKLNKNSGFSYKWDDPHEVNLEDSPYFGKFYMPLPEPKNPSFERVVQFWEEISAGYEVEVVEAESYKEFTVVSDKENYESILSDSVLELLKFPFKNLEFIVSYSEGVQTKLNDYNIHGFDVIEKLSKIYGVENFDLGIEVDDIILNEEQNPFDGTSTAYHLHNIFKEAEYLCNL